MRRFDLVLLSLWLLATAALVIGSLFSDTWMAIVAMVWCALVAGWAVMGRDEL